MVPEWADYLRRVKEYVRKTTEIGWKAKLRRVWHASRDVEDFNLLRDEFAGLIGALNLAISVDLRQVLVPSVPEQKDKVDLDIEAQEATLEDLQELEDELKANRDEVLFLNIIKLMTSMVNGCHVLRAPVVASILYCRRTPDCPIQAGGANKSRADTE